MFINFQIHSKQCSSVLFATVSTDFRTASMPNYINTILMEDKYWMKTNKINIPSKFKRKKRKKVKKYLRWAVQKAAKFH